MTVLSSNLRYHGERKVLMLKRISSMHGMESTIQDGNLYILDQTSHWNGTTFSRRGTWLDASEWTISQMYSWLGY